MEILNQVDQQKLKQDINNCFKFERMKQRYCTEGTPDDKLYPFFSKLTTLSKDVYKRAKAYFKTIESEAKEKQITNTKQYVGYSLLVSYMVDLAKVYDFFNEGKYDNKKESDTTNIQIMKSLLKPALCDNGRLLYSVNTAIDNYSLHKNEHNRRLILELLISAVRQIADRTKEYVEHCTDPLFEQFYKRYKSTYDALSKVDIKDKAWRAFSKSQVGYIDLEFAKMKISMLQNTAVELGDTRLAARLQLLSDRLLKIVIE